MLHGAKGKRGGDLSHVLFPLSMAVMVASSLCKKKTNGKVNAKKWNTKNQ